MAESLLHSLLTSKLPYLTLGETATDVLQRFVNVDVTTSALAETLKRNQLYRAGIESYVEQRLGSRAHAADKGDGGGEASLTYFIQLLGMLGTRNLVTSLRELRAFGEEWPFKPAPKTEDGAPAAPKPKAREGAKKFQPDDYLKYALKAQEFCQGYQVDNAESTAFAAGLLYDHLRLLTHLKTKKNAAVGKFFDENWREALKIAFYSARLADRVRGFGYAKYGFAAALVVNAGKYLICLDRARDGGSDWLDFEKQMEKVPDVGRREVRRILELEKFGMTHAEVSALALNYFGILKPVAPAVLHSHSPYYLEHVNHEIYQLSACVAAATMLADYGKPVEAGRDPLKSMLEQKWTRDLRLKEKDFIEITKEGAGVTTS